MKPLLFIYQPKTIAIAIAFPVDAFVLIAVRRFVPSSIKSLALIIPALMVTPVPTLSVVAVITPTTLIPEEFMVTAEPTIADVAVRTPTVILGLPERPKEVVAKDTDEIPVIFAPSPKNEVALTIPTISNFASGVVDPIPTLRFASTDIAFAFANLAKSLARVIYSELFLDIYTK
jgi:hypothetical protein